MPEYSIDYNDDAHAWHALDGFTQGYIEALFFTENSPAYSFADIEADKVAWEHDLSEGTSDGTIPGDAAFGDLAPNALAQCIDDCRAFQETNAALLQQAYENDSYSAEQAGQDYWFRRNGHGAGFWARGLGDVGDKLSDAARYSTVDVFLDAEGRVNF